jgi:hypothetical protein
MFTRPLGAQSPLESWPKKTTSAERLFSQILRVGAERHTTAQSSGRLEIWYGGTLTTARLRTVTSSPSRMEACGLWRSKCTFNISLPTSVFFDSVQAASHPLPSFHVGEGRRAKSSDLIHLKRSFGQA